MKNIKTAYLILIFLILSTLKLSAQWTKVNEPNGAIINNLRFIDNVLYGASADKGIIRLGQNSDNWEMITN